MSPPTTRENSTVNRLLRWCYTKLNLSMTYLNIWYVSWLLRCVSIYGMMTCCLMALCEHYHSVFVCWLLAQITFMFYGILWREGSWLKKYGTKWYRFTRLTIDSLLTNALRIFYEYFHLYVPRQSLLFFDHHHAQCQIFLVHYVTCRFNLGTFLTGLILPKQNHDHVHLVVWPFLV